MQALVYSQRLSRGQHGFDTEANSQTDQDSTGYDMMISTTDLIVA